MFSFCSFYGAVATVYRDNISALIVAGCTVGGVTFFSGLQDAVTAGSGRFAGVSGGWADKADFEGAGRRAAVAGGCVGVVAVFSICVLDTIATVGEMETPN